MTDCRWDRASERHLTPEHEAECIDRDCKGCRPCTHDEHGNPVTHCRNRRRCTSHLDWGEYTCPTCLSKIRANLAGILDALALMPDEAAERGIDSEAANLAGPHADYVSAQWRLVNADRAGEVVEELDMRDPYTCLTMHERTIREHLGHDETTLVSPTIAQATSYLDWALTDLARDEDATLLLAALAGDCKALLSHAEAVLLDSRTPERGIPCPDCSEALQREREAAGEGADLTGRGKAAPRLVRVYGHWCWRDGCTKVHYVDDSADVWRCPDGHEWTHADYEARLVERKATA